MGVGPPWGSSDEFLAVLSTRRAVVASRSVGRLCRLVMWLRHTMVRDDVADLGTVAGQDWGTVGRQRPGVTDAPKVSQPGRVSDVHGVSSPCRRAGVWQGARRR